MNNKKIVIIAYTLVGLGIISFLGYIWYTRTQTTQLPVNNVANNSIPIQGGVQSRQNQSDISEDEKRRIFPERYENVKTYTSKSQGLSFQVSESFKPIEEGSRIYVD